MPVLDMMDLTNQLLIKNPIFCRVPNGDKIDIYDFGVILLEVVTGSPITSIHEVEIMKEQVMITTFTGQLFHGQLTEPLNLNSLGIV